MTLPKRTCDGATSWIYALECAGEVLYVGFSNNPRQRVGRHRRERSWFTADTIPRILEQCTTTECVDRERFWIAHYKARGECRCNRNPGGGGTITHTPEARARISAACKGKKLPKRTPEHSRKISLANKGKPSWNKGVPRTAAVKEKLSRARKGMRLSEEWRNKIGASLIGGTRSVETKAKMSLARTRYWERRRALKEQTQC